MATITLKTSDISEVLTASRWWDLTTLRRLLGRGPATVIGHDFGPDPVAPNYAFLAADVSRAYSPGLKTVRRFFVVLRERGMLSFDIASGTGVVGWSLEGNPAPRLVHSALRPKTASGRVEEHAFLNALVIPTERVEAVSGMDLTGARVGDFVVFFHTRLETAGSALFYDVPGKTGLHFLIVGLSPGFWEVWKDGFMEDNARPVQPGKGTLYFEGEAGDYFLRWR